MRKISSEELNKNLDFYLKISKEEDILVMKDDEEISILTNPDKHMLTLINELAGKYGKIDDNIDYDKLLGEAIMEKCS